MRKIPLQKLSLHNQKQTTHQSKPPSVYTSRAIEICTETSRFQMLAQQTFQLPTPHAGRLQEFQPPSLLPGTPCPKSRATPRASTPHTGHQSEESEPLTAAPSPDPGRARPCGNQQLQGRAEGSGAAAPSLTPGLAAQAA